jgi:hypothetical protein
MPIRKKHMSLKSRCGLVAALPSILLLAQCGGQTELVAIETSSGGTSASTVEQLVVPVP